MLLCTVKYLEVGIDSARDKISKEKRMLGVKITLFSVLVPLLLFSIGHSTTYFHFHVFNAIGIDRAIKKVKIKRTTNIEL